MACGSGCCAPGGESADAKQTQTELQNREVADSGADSLEKDISCSHEQREPAITCCDGPGKDKELDNDGCCSPRIVDFASTVSCCESKSEQSEPGNSAIQNEQNVCYTGSGEDEEQESGACCSSQPPQVGLKDMETSDCCEGKPRPCCSTSFNQESCCTPLCKAPLNSSKISSNFRWQLLPRPMVAVLQTPHH